MVFLDKIIECSETWKTHFASFLWNGTNGIKIEEVRVWQEESE